MTHDPKFKFYFTNDAGKSLTITESHPNLEVTKVRLKTACEKLAEAYATTFVEATKVTETVMPIE